MRTVIRNMAVHRMLILFAVMFLIPASNAEEFIGGNFMLQAPLDEPKHYCLDLEGYGSTTDPGAPPIVHSCKEGWWRDGTYKVDYPHPGQIYLPDFDVCVEAVELLSGAALKMDACSDSAMQQFVWRKDGKVEVKSSSTNKYCLAVGETSRRTGANLRRETVIADCSEVDEKYSQWILPREDAVYPDVATAKVVSGERPAGARGGPRGGPRGHLYVGACSPCHGASGEGFAGEHSPKISGQEDWYLARQLANFVNDARGAGHGERWAKQMNFHVKDFTQAQLDSFVEYVVTLEDKPSEPTINGDIARGKQLYEQSCSACHAADGMGNKELNSPRLSGMTDWYMVTQLQKYRSGLRGVHPDDTIGLQMAPFAKALPDEESLNDVVAYINTLPSK